MNEFTKPYFDAVAQLMAPTAPFEIETVEVGGVPLRAFKNAETSLGAFLLQVETTATPSSSSIKASLGPTQIFLVPSTRSAIG